MTSASVPAAPAMLPTDRLAEVLAIMTVNLIEALDIRDRRAALEHIANRSTEQGRVAGGSTAAAMLGAVGGALMRLKS